MHKNQDSIFACILNEKCAVFQGKYGVLTPELEQLRSALQQHDVGEFCMERTSIGWMPVWRMLETHVSLEPVTPYFIRQLPGKIKSRSITHGNKYLRRTLVECAWAASKTQGCFYSRFSHHQTVDRRKNAKKVKIAVARKMLTAIWFMLHDNVAYRNYPTDTAAADA